MDMLNLRQDSWDIALGLGFPKNDALPLLDPCGMIRSKDEVVDRVFGMLCLAASAFGLGRTKALAWLEREGNLEILTSTERKFLGGSRISPTPFMDQIEGMWALCWSLKVVPNLDFSGPCSSDFVRLLPDLKKEETGVAFRKRSSLRGFEEVVAKCDLAYCLHWGIVHGGLTGRLKREVEPYVVVERRRALEWLFLDEAWDELPLDT